MQHTRTITIVLGLLASGCLSTLGGSSDGTPKYNALNHYGAPTDGRYASYFDAAVEGPTAADFVGALPADLSAVDIMDASWKALAHTSPNTAEASLRFERAEGDRVCFSDLMDDVKVRMSKDDVIGIYRARAYVIEAIKDRAALGDRAMWPATGDRITDIKVTRDEIEDKDTPRGIERVRTVDVELCGPRPAKLAGAGYLAVVMHTDEVTGLTSEGLLLWRLGVRRQ